MKQYEIWWAQLPRPIGRRPVLLLSRDSAFDYLTRFIVVEITTRIRNIPIEVALGPGEGLPAKSVANFDNLHVVPKASLVSKLGVVRPGRQVELKRALGYALGWDELKGARGLSLHS